MQTIALIMAAGKGVRAGGEVAKQYQEIAGTMVLRHTLLRFIRHADIDRVIAVINPEDEDLYQRAAAGLQLDAPVHGGDSRQASVLLGLEALTGFAPDLVLIHDAARPFTDQGTIDRVILALTEAAGAIAAIPVTDTLKLAQGHDIQKRVARENLWRAQTPQGFRYRPILEAHRGAVGLNLTDDAEVAEHAGLQVQLTQGAADNFKITLPEDFVRAERLLAAAPRQTRMGQGYDVHRFKPGQAVMLCGVEIAHSRALDGHSDADVGLHALTDAILGAIAQGDIGQHFPPTDPQWKGAASDVFLAHAGKLVRDSGGEIINLDITLICEAPRIGPYRIQMQQRIEQILGLPPGCASVKATTTEGLGFTGRNEGIAAQAIAVVSLPA